MFPWHANLVMEKRRRLRPGTYITSCSTAFSVLPLSSVMLRRIFPVIEHLMTWSLATSTPKFCPSTTLNRSAQRGVMCCVAPESGRKFPRSQGSPISANKGSFFRTANADAVLGMVIAILALSLGDES